MLIRDGGEVCGGHIEYDTSHIVPRYFAGCANLRMNASSESRLQNALEHALRSLPARSDDSPCHRLFGEHQDPSKFQERRRLRGSGGEFDKACDISCPELLQGNGSLLET